MCGSTVHRPGTDPPTLAKPAPPPGTPVSAAAAPGFDSSTGSGMIGTKNGHAFRETERGNRKDAEEVQELP